jgi:hypothetical protein
MKYQKKFNPQQQQEHAIEQRAEQKAVREFATAEELLRYDAAHTAVPVGIAHRLQKSSADLAAPAKSWWQKLFRKQ